MVKLKNTELLNFSVNKDVPLILQAEIAECGLASMAMIASYHGHQLDMPAMRKRFSANLKGMNLQQLIELADSLGLASRALQCPIDEVHKLSDTLHFTLGFKSFCCADQSVRQRTISQILYVNDPAVGKTHT